MSVLTRIWNVMRRGRLDDDLRQELETHLALIEEDERAQGRSSKEARLKARLRFGNPMAHRERALDVVLATWLDSAWHDVRYGVRQLAVSPVLSAVLIFTLGLGIGATVAIFSVVNVVLLRPLPYKDSDRIVMVFETYRLMRGSASPGHFRDWTEQGTVFEATAATQPATYNFADQGDPERVSGTRVTPDYFRVANIPPVIGRYFTAQEGEAGERVVVLSHGLWQRRFGADPFIVGRQIRLSGEPYSVVGIAPASYGLTDSDLGPGAGGFSSQLWTPLVFSSEQRANYGNHSFRVLAKLRPGVTRDRAQADMERVTRGIAERNPQAMQSRGVNVQLFSDTLVTNSQTQLVVIFGAVGFVLLIGCANVSSLLLARATTRRKEIAVRAALGGGRRRILRQLVTESLVFALAGGIAALGVAELGIRFLVNSGPPNLPRLRDAGLHPDVLLFALMVSLLAGVLFGLAPALRVVRANLQDELREGGKSSLPAGSRDRLRGVLVVAEIAVTVVLLVGASLFIRSALRLQQVPYGFSSENVLTARVALPAARYAEPDVVTDAYRRILEQVRAIPGVERAAASTNIPLGGGSIDVGLSVEGKTFAPGAMPGAHFRIVTEDYFEATRVPLRRGRLLQASDMVPGAPPVLVINERLATSLWPGDNPLRKRVSGWTPGSEPEWREVVGVVGDVRTFGRGTPVEPEMFLPYSQAPASAWNGFQRSMALVARTADDPADSAAMLRRAVWTVDPSLPLYDVRTMDQVLAASTATRRFNTLLLSLLAATGLVLAAVGIYGVIAYFVTERTPEIGLRLALGATTGSVLSMVLKHSALLGIAGIAAGTLAALAATRVLTTLLFEISATDAPSYALGALGLFAITLLASALPALRATRIDPVRSLTGS